MRDSIPAEPDANDPSAIKILLKLPNGTRLERHFLKTHSLKVGDWTDSSDDETFCCNDEWSPLCCAALAGLCTYTVYMCVLFQHLYNYVFVHESAPDDFQIVTNFPRKVLPCMPTDEAPEPPSFEDVGLGKAELLFVHDNEA